MSGLFESIVRLRRTSASSRLGPPHESDLSSAEPTPRVNGTAPTNGGPPAHAEVALNGSAPAEVEEEPVPVAVEPESAGEDEEPMAVPVEPPPPRRPYQSSPPPPRSNRNTRRNPRNPRHPRNPTPSPPAFSSAAGSGAARAT